MVEEGPGLLVVIGCGNPNRGDDGVGPHVARVLRDALPPLQAASVRIVDAGTAGMEVMFQARGATRLVIVDAVQGSGAPPGAVFEVPGDVLAREHAPSFSLHDFRWQHALAAGRRIFREQFPREVTVLLVEAQSLALGLELSEPVRAGAEHVVTRLRQMIEEAPANPMDTTVGAS